MTRIKFDLARTIAIDRPIFILGTQRSGTTLLCSMFDRHPDVVAVNEYWDGYPFLAEQDRDQQRFINSLAARFEADPEELGEVGDVPPFELYRYAAGCILRKHGGSRFLLKDPGLTYHLPLFDKEFPDARYIYLVRDPRATCLSQLSRHWNVANAYYGAKLWRDNQGVLVAFQQAHSDRVMRINFESLLDEPEQHLRRLCEFVEIKYDSAMLKFYEERGVRKIHIGNENTTKPLQQGVTEKWRKQLSKRQIAIVDYECREMMATLGYAADTEGKRLNAMERRWLYAHQWFWTTYWWQRRTNWSALRRLPRPLASLARAVLVVSGQADASQNDSTPQDATKV